MEEDYENRGRKKNPFSFGGWTYVIAGFIIVMVIAFLWGAFLVSIPPGHVGVKEIFGDVQDDYFTPGLHLKVPWVGVHPISVQTEKYLDYGSPNDDTADITALSNDGLSTTMGIAVNYHLVTEKLPELYDRVGTDYSNVIMINPIHSVPRDLISKYDTKTLYSASRAGTADRAKLEQELLDGIRSKIDTVGVPGSIAIEQVYIRNIDFPDAYKNTITAKMNMDTEIATKRSQLEKEKIDAEIKVVVAKADAEANIARATGDAESTRIRNSQQPSKAILQLAWIQSMKDNPKVMYVPIGEDGLPLFKNVDSS